ncbi:hypothetical protein [Roseisolibacter agri]|uniref:hypothetical protein n=1 Tax=Roseisolibacter agri TaxID=2014610 RepID=UPI0024E0A2D5|nr:hypothetical protein [Roseisolibacter agri]
MPRSHLVAALLLASATVTATAGAQPADSVHQGFWIGVGAGTGWQSFECVTCGPPPVPAKWRSGRSGGGYLAMGGTLRPNLLLGGEIAVNLNAAEEPSASVGHVGVVGQLYPTRGRRLFLRAGVGVGVAILVDPARGFPEDEELGSGGLAFRAGIGYDVRLGGRFALAPYVDVMQALASGDVRTVDGRAYRGPRNPAALQAGLSLNWY